MIHDDMHLGEQILLVLAALALLCAVALVVTSPIPQRPVDPYNPANATPYREEP